MKIFLVLFLQIFVVSTLSVQDISIVKRPQEPTEPYPYFSEDVKFQNRKANIIDASESESHCQGIFLCQDQEFNY